jgi:hypothetical protein
MNIGIRSSDWQRKGSGLPQALLLTFVVDGFGRGI